MESLRENEMMVETSDSSSWEDMLMSEFDFYSDTHFKHDQDSSNWCAGRGLSGFTTIGSVER